MVVIIGSGAFKVMCQHIELKKNTWYYRRRIPIWAQAFHKTAPNAKLPQQIYRSLETFDKLVANSGAATSLPVQGADLRSSEAGATRWINIKQGLAAD